MRQLVFVMGILCAFSLQAQVGIGTTNPQATLHIVGDFKFKPNKTVKATRLVGLNITGDLKEFPLGDDFDIVDGVIEINEVLDANEFLVGNLDQSSTAVSTDRYDNYDIGITSSNQENTIIRLTGETQGFDITGFDHGFDGRVIYVYNAQNHNVTFLPLNANSDPENQIMTIDGNNSGLQGEGVAEFIYSATLQKWIMINKRG